MFEQIENLVHHNLKEPQPSFQDIRERQRETDRRMRGIIDSLGLFAEQVAEPAVLNLFHKRGIVLTGDYHRLWQKRNGDTMEIDLLLEGREAVVAIEVRRRLETEDVKELLNELPYFFLYFPSFRERTLYGAVAGMSIEENVVRYASRQGLFVLAPSGENVQIMNDKKIQPRVFGEPARKLSRKRAR